MRISPKNPLIVIVVICNYFNSCVKGIVPTQIACCFLITYFDSNHPKIISFKTWQSDTLPVVSLGLEQAQYAFTCEVIYLLVYHRCYLHVFSSSRTVNLYYLPWPYFQCGYMLVVMLVKCANLCVLCISMGVVYLIHLVTMVTAVTVVIYTSLFLCYLYVKHCPYNPRVMHSCWGNYGFCLPQ